LGSNNLPDDVLAQEQEWIDGALTSFLPSIRTRCSIRLQLQSWESGGGQLSSASPGWLATVVTGDY
jgi:hypothetical protein